VEVYKIEQMTEAGTDPVPIQTIETEAKGLSSVVTGSDKIFMGFCGSMMSPNAQVQVFSHEYEKLETIELDQVQDSMVSSMVLCHNEKFLVCTHRFGLITIINTEDYNATTGAFLE